MTDPSSAAQVCDCFGLTGTLAHDPACPNAAQVCECWINGARFAHDGVKEHMTGAQIRALPLPSLRDSDDLFVEVPGGEDLLVEYDEVVPVAGRRFFSVPRFINAG